MEAGVEPALQPPLRLFVANVAAIHAMARVLIRFCPQGYCRRAAGRPLPPNGPDTHAKHGFEGIMNPKFARLLSLSVRVLAALEGI